MRGVERVWVLLRQEALRSGSSVALKDKEANALRNLARLTSLVAIRSAKKTVCFLDLRPAR